MTKSTLRPSVLNFFTCRTGAAMFFLGWLGFALLVWVHSTLPRRIILTEVSRIQSEDSPIPLFKAIVYSMSWPRKPVNRPGVQPVREKSQHALIPCRRMEHIYTQTSDPSTFHFLLVPEIPCSLLLLIFEIPCMKQSAEIYVTRL